MALIKCSECDKEISDKAKSCPNCGNPMLTDKEKQNEKNKNALILILLIIISTIIIFNISYFIYNRINEYNEAKTLYNKASNIVKDYKNGNFNSK